MTRFILDNTNEVVLSDQLQFIDDSILALVIKDHLGGFDQTLRNIKLDLIENYANIKNKKIDVYTSYVFDESVTKHYPGLNFKLDLFKGLTDLADYNQHPEINFKNFLCSFNGTPHVSRKLLVCALKKFGYFNPLYCSKNFALSADTIDGHVCDFVEDKSKFYLKFFETSDQENFLNTIYKFDGFYQEHGSNREHSRNIYSLESKLTASFVNLVSETFATSYVPFFTEKFLYSVVTRGLFLSYAQPSWHEHLEKYWGFKKYTQLFDYSFDRVQNPVERLISLLTMLSKFKNLSFDELYDLYQLEMDTIEYNYDHYFSGDYQKKLAKFS